MAIKLLQAEQDIDVFVDYLYDLGYSLTRSGGTLKGILLERQRAKDSLNSDLVCTMNGSCYWIVAESRYIIMDFNSCGGRSHPRCTERMCRNPGIITHCYGREKTEAAEVLMKKIRLFFKKGYVFKNCQSKAKENCFWGPHYQAIDESYLKKPEPAYVCPGYIRVVYEENSADIMLARVESVLSQYEAIQLQHSACIFPREQLCGVEVYVSFLCNRNYFSVYDLEKLVDSLGPVPGRALAKKEKLYIEANTCYRNSKQPNTNWNVFGFVENEWKGFGNFEF